MDSRVSFAKIFSKVVYVILGIGIMVCSIKFWSAGPHGTLSSSASSGIGFIIFFGGAVVEMLIIMFTNLLICIAENSCEIAYYTKYPADEKQSGGNNNKSHPLLSSADNNQIKSQSLFSPVDNNWICSNCNTENSESTHYCSKCRHPRTN